MLIEYNDDANTKKIAELKKEMATLIAMQKTEIETQNTKKIDELKTEMNQLKNEMEALNSKKISDLKTEIETQNAKKMDESKTEIKVLKIPQGPIVMLHRKEAGNPVDYFDKTFAEYQEGFESNGRI